MTVGIGQGIVNVVNIIGFLGEIYQLVFKFQNSSLVALANEDVVDDMEEFANQFALAWEPVGNILTTFDSGVVSKWELPASQVNIGDYDLGVNGSLAVNALPLPSSLLLSVPLVEERGSGKKYVPGLTEQDQTDGQWDAAALVAGAVMGVLYRDQFVSAIDPARVYDPITIVPTTGEQKVFGTSVRINGIVRIQRRRNPR